MCRKFLLLSIWGLSIVASLPLAALAADPPTVDFTTVTTTVSAPDGGTVLVTGAGRRPSEEDADAATGPILVAPQNEHPATSREASGSSRRQWLGLRRTPAVDPPEKLETAQKLAYDDSLILIDDYALLHDAQGNYQPDDQPAAANRAARAAAWCGQRLKRALIEVHGAAITYSCEQPDASAGPKLLPPQQAKPIAALAEADVDNLQLDPDEPAKVILDIREQVGPKLFEGTIFEDTGWRARASAETPRPDHRAQLVRCIRDMAQNREACEDHCEFDACTGTTNCTAASCPATGCPATCATLASLDDAEPSTSPSAVPALRQASRQLDKLAESLEEQKLYDRADELRAMAQQLREQARGSDSQMPIERSARK